MWTRTAISLSLALVTLVAAYGLLEEEPRSGVAPPSATSVAPTQSPRLTPSPLSHTIPSMFTRWPTPLPIPPPGCPVTIPGQVPLPASVQEVVSRRQIFGSGERGEYMHGGKVLWVAGLPADGVAVLQPREQDLSLKVAWWRHGLGALRVTGQRLDGPAPPLRFQPGETYAAGMLASSLIFPTEGCWEIIGRFEGQDFNGHARHEEVRVVLWVRSRTPVSTYPPAIQPEIVVVAENSDLPAGCGARQVADLITRFFAAFNRGDREELVRFFRPDHFRGWYSVGERPARHAPRLVKFVLRDDLLAYFAQRHQRHERLQLRALSVIGPSWHGGVDLTFILTRQADDLEPGLGGPASIAHGKGAVDCDEQTIFVWSMAMNPAEATPDYLCGRRLSDESPHTVIVCGGQTMTPPGVSQSLVRAARSGRI